MGWRSGEELSNVMVVKLWGFRDLKVWSNYDLSLVVEFFSMKLLKGLGVLEEVIGVLLVFLIRKLFVI